MKQILFTLCLLLSLTVINGCYPDKCKSVSCANNGVCVDGTCQCLAPWTGPGCTIDTSKQNGNPGGNPTNTTGSVSGNVSPANKVAAVTLTPNSGGQVYSGDLNTSSGDFSFIGIPAGNYQLEISSNTPLYSGPSPKSISVQASVNTNAGSFSMTANSASQTGQVSFAILGVSNHTLYYNNFSASLASSVFEIVGAEGKTPYYYFQMKLVSFNGVGTYRVYNNPSIIRLVHYPTPGNADGHWSTDNGGDGQIVISSYDAVNRKISGSFTGNLAPQGASSGTKQISGAFADVVF